MFTAVADAVLVGGSLFTREEFSLFDGFALLALLLLLLLLLLLCLLIDFLRA